MKSNPGSRRDVLPNENRNLRPKSFGYFSLKGNSTQSIGLNLSPVKQSTVKKMIVEIVLDDKTYEVACHMALKQKQDVPTFLSNVIGGALLYLEEMLA